MSAELAARLRDVEERLDRLLVSGWRNAGPEAAALVTEADALAEIGLAELAARLRAVAAAQGGMAALGAIALAVSASRLLRARLPAEPPSPDWTPLALTRRRRKATSERLLPIGRLPLADGQAWACLRLHGGGAAGWVLIDPPDLPEPPADPAPAPGLAARLLGRGRGLSAEPEVGPWLRRPLQGALRWRARYPLGASGEVQRCAIVEPSWVEPAEDDQILADLARARSDRRLPDDWTVPATSLRLKLLEPSDTESCVWPDPAAALAFQAAATRAVSALAWVQGSLVTPLVLLDRGGLLPSRRLIHLAPHS